MVTGSLLFGGFYVQFLLIFQKDNQKLRSLFFWSLFGISVLIILNDHKFIGLFVQGLIQTFPSVPPLAQRPFGQACLLFGSGIFILSAGFPTIVTFFYAWALYASGLYTYI